MDTGYIYLTIFAVVVGTLVAGLFRYVPKWHRYDFILRLVEFLIPFALASAIFLWGEDNAKVALESLATQPKLISVLTPVVLSGIALALFALLIYEALKAMGKVEEPSGPKKKGRSGRSRNIRKEKKEV